MDFELERFMAGQMSTMEEEAFLEKHPHIERAIDVSMMLDGEAEDFEVKRAMKALLGSQALQDELQDLMFVDAWVEEHVRVHQKPHLHLVHSEELSPEAPKPAPIDSEFSKGSLCQPSVRIADRGWLKNLMIAAAAAAVVAFVVFGQRTLQESRIQRALSKVDAFILSSEPSELSPRWSYQPKGSSKLPEDDVFPEQAVEMVGKSGRVTAAVAAYAKDGRYQQAETILRGAPQSADVWSDLAGVQLLLAEPKDAQRFAQLAVAEDKHHRPARWNLAIASWRLGLETETLKALSWIAENDSGGWRRTAENLRTRLARPLIALLRPPDSGVAKYRGDADFGAVLEISAHIDPIPTRHTALRVYLKNIGLVRSCPSEDCQGEGDFLRTELTLDSRGVYQVVRFTSNKMLGPTRGSVDEDIENLDGEFVLEEFEVR